jgi:ABC-2 type transport system ATP-binding protein
MPASAPAAALQFDALTKRYGGGPLVLDQISFAVQPGEFFGLAGVNGAGKTSLIKCLLDLADFASGQISIFGESSARFESRRRLAYLPERFIPPHYLTGRGFLKMMASLHGHNHDEGQAQAIFEQLDLESSALTRPVRVFSKGMTQKLGLAAAFLARRELMILDEPMSGLDPKARARVKDRLFALRDGGGTLFFTSHALADVEEICDRIAILHEGRIAFLGAPRDLIRDTRAATLERAFLHVIERSGTIAA